MKIALAGGGSGGHAIPALTLAQALRRRGDEILVIGSHQGVEAELFRRAEFPYHAISTGKFRRYLDWRHLTDPFRVLAGILQSIRILRRTRPDLLFTTGGFVSLPPVLAAALLHIPVAIHEQTIAVGLANRIAARFARRVCLAFPESAAYFPAAATVVTGMPLREELQKPATWPSDWPRREALPLLFVSGGAQGSRRINGVLAEILPALREKYDIVHQYGTRQESPRETESPGYIPRPFIRDELPAVLQEASLLIGRSGAGTVHDCAVSATPAILIPLPHATKDEQMRNARWLQQRGGAEILPEAELTAARLLETIETLFRESRVPAMQSALASCSDVDGTAAILAVMDAIARR